jgi:F0F1-type ATP synthase delta subunit
MQLFLRIIGLMAGLLPGLTELIKAVERVFGGGTGAVKKDVVKSTVIEALREDPSFEGIPVEVLDRVVDGAIERQLEALKKTGPFETQAK